MDLDMNTAVASIGEGLGLGDGGGLDSGESGSGGSDDLDSGAGGVPAVGEGRNAEGAGDTGGETGSESGSPEVGTGVEGEVAPGTQPAAFTPPKTWTPAAAAELAKASPAVQAEVLKREEDFFRGIEGYKQDAALGKQFATVLSPYMPLLNHYNVDAGVLIPNLMEAHKTLSLGSVQEKIAYFRKLGQDYGVPMDEVAAEVPYEDPEVKRLREENRTLQSERQRSERAQVENARSTAAAILDKFIADPKNIYFNEVGDDIARLMQSGVCKTLEEAYEKAVWANPATRAKEQTRLDKAKADQVRKDAEAKAAAARRATAANTRSSAKSASGTAALGSMDDTISSTLRTIHKRV